MPALKADLLPSSHVPLGAFPSAFASLPRSYVYTHPLTLCRPVWFQHLLSVLDGSKENGFPVSPYWHSPEKETEGARVGEQSGPRILFELPQEITPPGGEVCSHPVTPPLSVLSSGNWVTGTCHPNNFLRFWLPEVERTCEFSSASSSHFSSSAHRHTF